MRKKIEDKIFASKTKKKFGKKFYKKILHSKIKTKKGKEKKAPLPEELAATTGGERPGRFPATARGEAQGACCRARRGAHRKVHGCSASTLPCRLSHLAVPPPPPPPHISRAAPSSRCRCSSWGARRRYCRRSTSPPLAALREKGDRKNREGRWKQTRGSRVKVIRLQWTGPR